MPTFQHILVPTDFGEISDRALSRALDLAQDLGAKLTLVHVRTRMPRIHIGGAASRFGSAYSCGLRATCFSTSSSSAAAVNPIIGERSSE